PCSTPSAAMAAIPCGIEAWRKPAVLEKISTANRGSAISAATLSPADAPSIAPTTSSGRGASVRRTMSRRQDCWVTALRRDLTLSPEIIEPKETTMKWKTPVIIEIAVGLEINAYACAEVK